MTPSKAFIIGDFIKADVEVSIFGVNYNNNESCLLGLTFLDAICYIDDWSGIARQDWRFFWWNYEKTDATHIIYQKTVYLFYVHEGTYGLNVELWLPKNPPGLDAPNFYYPDLVNIKPYSYLEDKKRTMLNEGLNRQILGLTIITIVPIVALLYDNLIDFIESLLTNNKRSLNI